MPQPGCMPGERAIRILLQSLRRFFALAGKAQFGRSVQWKGSPVQWKGQGVQWKGFSGAMESWSSQKGWCLVLGLERIFAYTIISYSAFINKIRSTD